MDAKVFARFMSKVDTSAGPGECWPWTGGYRGGGYGQFNLPRPEGGYQPMTASRAMYLHLHGPLEPGLVVRHTCDNPPCVNPSHLIAGTRSDNARDMVERERQSRGEDHPKRVLTENMVRELRTRAQAGENISAMAREMGVSISAAMGAVKGRTWKHITDPPPVQIDWRLPEDQVGYAREQVRAGRSIASLARETGITYPSLVTAIRGNHPSWDRVVHGVPPVRV